MCSVRRISNIFNVTSFSNNLQKPRSCLEAWNQGARTSGFYLIQGRTECLFYQMYCDFSSEPGWAWTLVMSQGFGNRGQIFAKSPFLKGAPKNHRTPNWEMYRIGKGRMWVIKESSSHWRVTCDFPNFGVDFRDYLRAAFQRPVENAARWTTSIFVGITVQDARRLGGKTIKDF